MQRRGSVLSACVQRLTPRPTSIAPLERCCSARRGEVCGDHLPINSAPNWAGSPTMPQTLLRPPARWPSANFNSAGLRSIAASEYLLVPKLARNHVRRLVLAQCPNVNRPTRVRIPHRKIMPRRAHPDASRIIIEIFACQRQVAQRRRQKHICSASARHQISRDILMVSRHVLRRCRFVINVQRVNHCPVIQQIRGNLHRRGNMKRCLTITPSGMDNTPIR